MTEIAEHPERTIGRLEGRMDALEARADRRDAQLDERLNVFEKKLDSVLSAIASGRGERRVFGGVLHWILTGALAIGAWFHGHVTGGQ